MKTVYQLVATGPRAHFSGQGSILSKTIFLNKEKAENHKDDFSRNCTATVDGVGEFQTLASVDHCSIVELELDDGE